jgi:hypothetical protein
MIREIKHQSLALLASSLAMPQVWPVSIGDGET